MRVCSSGVFGNGRRFFGIYGVMVGGRFFYVLDIIVRNYILVKVCFMVIVVIGNFIFWDFVKVIL